MWSECVHVWIQNKLILIISCLLSSYFQGCKRQPKGGRKTQRTNNFDPLKEKNEHLQALIHFWKHPEKFSSRKAVLHWLERQDGSSAFQ